MLLCVGLMDLFEHVCRVFQGETPQGRYINLSQVESNIDLLSSRTVAPGANFN